jgi:sulfite reductase (NADPH) flavoprotein alpha-component
VSGQRDLSLIVAFGTDMGNAEDAAMTFAAAVGAIGIDTEAIELNRVELADLQSATHFVVVTSTFGDGEFPDNAVLFWEAISADTGRLENLSFAVLALGDSSYELFCNAGLLLDERLGALGAHRLTERVDVDGFYEQPAATWTTDVVKLLADQQTTAAEVSVTAGDAHSPEPAEPSIRERHHPVQAQLSVNQLLTAPESD